MCIRAWGFLTVWKPERNQELRSWWNWKTRYNDNKYTNITWQTIYDKITSRQLYPFLAVEGFCFVAVNFSFFFLELRLNQNRISVSISSMSVLKIKNLWAARTNVMRCTFILSVVSQHSVITLFSYLQESLLNVIRTYVLVAKSFFFYRYRVN